MLSNDEDRDHPAANLSVVNVTHSIVTATQGTLAVEPNGAFVFTAAHSGVDGAFVFSYQIQDVSRGLSAPATVTLLISSTDLGPVIAADDISIPQFATIEDTPLVIDAATGPAGEVGFGVLANDQHVGEESAPVVIEVVRHPESGGTVVFSALDRGGFTYTPGADFDGIDSFSYRVFDGVTYSNEAVVNLIVQSVDDPPVASDDEFFVPSGGVLAVDAAVGVLVNDADAEEDALNGVELVEGQGTQHGVLVLFADGGFTYTPGAAFVGTDQFQYTVSAGGVRSLPATVTLHVESSSCAFRADVNGDGAVDLADVAMLVGEFGSSDAAGVDIDCNGRVGLLDLIRVQNSLQITMPSAPAAIVAASRRIAAVDAALAADSAVISVVGQSASPRRFGAEMSRASVARAGRDVAVANRDPDGRGNPLQARRIRRAQGNAAAQTLGIATGDAFDH